MLPTPRWCPRERRMTLWGRAVVYGRKVKACRLCGTATKAREPKAKPKAKKPLGWKRAEVKAAGDLTPEQWQTIVAFYGGLCAWCERAPWCQQDHVHPIARGGQHTAGNVVPSCAACNYAKGTARGRSPRRRHPFMAPVTEEQTA